MVRSSSALFQTGCRKLVATLEVGSSVALVCRGAKATVPRLARVTLLARPVAGHNTPVTGDVSVSGLLSDPGSARVAVTGGERDRTLTCNVPAELATAVSALTIGDSA